METFIIDVDTEWQNKASAHDLKINLKNFTPGQAVKVRIISGNDGGDAAPIPVATVPLT